MKQSILGEGHLDICNWNNESET